MELYAPYVRTDGLIQRVTVYEDYEYTIPVQNYEKYSNRGDYLAESKKNFIMNTITDFFEKGRSDHCKGTIRSKNVISYKLRVNRFVLLIKIIVAHCYLASDSDSINGERTIDFYDIAQFDGLSRIEIGPLYLTQHYVDREDFLYYR